jgi:hypothetical protein
MGARIHLNQREDGNRNEIDAVELVGIEAEWWQRIANRTQVG